jgi:hypothetical protein
VSPICTKFFSYISTSDITDDEIQDEMRGSLDVQARLLYGLIHARWIVTARGLQKMVHILLCFLSSSFTTTSSRNTNEQTLGVALVFSAPFNLSSLLGSLMSLTKSPSNSTAGAVKTFTHPNPRGMALSTVHTLALPSHTSCSLSTPT